MRNARLWFLVAAIGMAAGCTKGGSKSEPTSEVAEDAGAEAAADLEACAGAEAKGPLKWFHDDYPGALACARASNRPLFIDLWAPWCHTCIAMKSGVFMDPALEPLADRFVWLAIDTDKAENASVQVTYPPQVWPTFYIVSPHDESIQARYLGAASVTQFRAFLSQGEKGFLEAAGAELAPNSPLRLVRDGDRAVAAGDIDTALRAYRAALDKAPEDWPRRPDVLVALISVLASGQEWEPCAELAEAELQKTGRSASVTDFIYRVRVCADKLEDQDRALALRKSAIARLEALIDDADAPLSKDDRSDAMYNLRELYLALGQDDKARALAERQRAFLDQAAAEAPNPYAAMTYNWPRAEVYVYLGRPAELVPALQKSVADLPNEYDPPYRLAWVYLQLGENDKALEHAERALSLVYGPRKARVQRLVAAIHKERGDKEAERAAREKVVAIYEGLPEGQRSESALEEARAELAAMEPEEKEEQTDRPARVKQPKKAEQPKEPDEAAKPDQAAAPKEPKESDEAAQPEPDKAKQPESDKAQQPDEAAQPAQ